MTILPPVAPTTADPFLITGPAIISFSGGRTSAYMLWRILRAHGGTLPGDVVVCFANTGREIPATLDFVARCGQEWGVHIVWLEFRHSLVEGKTRRIRWAEIVSHNSASRNGEPFDMLLESKRIVPDRSRRFCSEQLKVLTIQRYLQSRGWRRWANIVGLRADESARIDDKMAYDAAHPGPFTSIFPLADAGVQEFEILKLWRGGSFGFDLQLDHDGDGGNCDGCFLHSADRIARMFRKYPERMDWWPRTEARYGSKTMRPERSYSEIREVALNQGILPWSDAEDAAPCPQACGV